MSDLNNPTGTWPNWDRCKWCGSAMLDNDRSCRPDACSELTDAKLRSLLEVARLAERDGIRTVRGTIRSLRALVVAALENPAPALYTLHPDGQFREADTGKVAGRCYDSYAMIGPSQNPGFLRAAALSQPSAAPAGEREAMRAVEEHGLSLIRSEDGWYAIKAVDVLHGHTPAGLRSRACR